MLRPACSSESMRPACACRSRSACTRWTASAARSPTSRAKARPAAGRRPARGPRSTRQPFVPVPRPNGTQRREGSRSGSPLRSISRSAGRSSSSQTSPSCTFGAPAAHTSASSAWSYSMTRQHCTARASRSVARAMQRRARRATGASLPGRATGAAHDVAAHRRRRRGCSRPGAAARARLPVGAVPPAPAAFAALEKALQVSRQEPPLPAGRPAAGNDTRVGPASQGVFTHLEHLGCGRYAQPAAAAARPPHPLSPTPYARCRPIGLVTSPTLR